jgi:hypothetical protein
MDGSRLVLKVAGMTFFVFAIKPIALELIAVEGGWEISYSLGFVMI